MLRFLVLALLLSVASPAFALNAKQRAKVDAWAAEASELTMDGGDLRKAHRTAMKALRRDDGHPIALFALAMVMIHTIEQGLATEAEVEEMQPIITEVFEIVIAERPDSREGAMARAALAAESPVGPALEPPEVSCEGAEEPMTVAAIAFGKGDYDTALGNYDQALLTCPTDPVLLTYSGNAFLAQDRFVEAIDRYERAIEVAPCFWVAHRFVADARLRAGDWGGGIEALTRSVGCNPDDTLGWQALESAVEQDRMTVVRPWVRALGVVLSDGELQIDLIEDGTPTGKLLDELAGVHSQALLEWDKLSAGETPLQRTVSVLTPLLPLFTQKVEAATSELDRSHPRFMLWSMLEQAHRDGALPAAVLVLLFDRTLADDLRGWHQDTTHRLELAAYVRSLIKSAR